jgi:hypothetical protein
LPTALLLLLAAVDLRAAEDEYEQPPIEYSQSQPDNPVSRLQAELERGERQLPYDDERGYLPAILDALDVPVESQMLVFSKTSMQRTRISPRTPRAIYFNDDVYVGYCQSGEVVEIAAADPKLGAVFYTVRQEPASPALARQTQSCLQCHGAAQVQGVPGLLARSVYVSPAGMPLLSEGSHRVDHTTPLKDRWGGWYVTGRHGSQTHLGNLIVRDPDARQSFANADGMNLTDLTGRFNVARYPTPHSDLAALMVFEHQAYVHNLITKANFETRRALHYEAELNRALGDPLDTRLESTTRRIAHAGDKLVEGLLFANEARLAEPISGTSSFAERFAERGPRDRQGRSLRDFDLETRMFKYPCSYLVYSAAFDGLPDAMQRYVAERLRTVLTGRDASGAFTHLSADDRAAILEILTETKPELWSR